MIRIYGIRNCSTMRDALEWLEMHGIGFEFHDYKKTGVPRERLAAWCKAAGWKTLLNTKGATFRKLPPDRKEVTTQSQAVALMTEFPSLIKRPVIETAGGQLLIGFDPALFASFVL